jgi:glutamyl-tRNA synthetase
VELGERLEEYLTRVGFYREPAAVEVLAKAGPEALAAAVEGAESAHVPAMPPDEEQEGLTRIVAPLVREKMDVLADFIPMAGWFFRPLVFSDEAAERLAATPSAAEVLREAAVVLADLDVWAVELIEPLVRELPQRLGVKPKAVFAALRLGMSGQSVTPGLFESLWVLGREDAVGRLTTAAALV